MVDVEEAWLAASSTRASLRPRRRARPARAGAAGDAASGWRTSRRPAATRRCRSSRCCATRLRDARPDAARWLHRGLTSQDVVDTALMLCARDAVARVRGRARATRSAGSPTWSRSTGRRRWSARTLTQHAVPTTFGLKAAGWLTGVLDAYDDVGGAGPAGPGRRRRRHHGRRRRAGRAAARPGRRRAAARPRPRGRPRPRRRRRRGTRPGPPSPGSATRASAAPTPGGGSPTTCSPSAGPEIGELSEGSRRRLVDDAAQGQPGALRAGPPGRADHAPARGHPAPRRRRVGRRALRRRRGTPSGPRSGRCCAAPWSPASRPTELLGRAPRARRPDAADPRRGATGVRAEQRALADLLAVPRATTTGRDRDYLGAAGPLVDAVLARARDPTEETR